MPRSLRSDFAGQIYHALNRGNARNKIFFKDADFEAFERVVQLGLEKYPVDLIAYQWMGNHWHMVISPQKDKAMSAFLGVGNDDSYAAVSRAQQNNRLWARLPGKIQEFSGTT